MNDREKEIAKKISAILPKLDEKKQNYILGVTEGMVLARNETESKQPEMAAK